jgi:hypothetical protein
MMRIDKRIEKGSEIAAMVAVLIGVALFISEMIFEFPSWMHHFMDAFELILCAVFFTELSIHFINAKRKRRFLARHWFYVVTITPFTRIFGLFGEGAKAAKAAHLLGHAKYTAAGLQEVRWLSMLNKASFGLIREVLVIMYHLNRCDFEEVPREMHVAYVNTYVSPHADKQVALGILEGMKHYAKTRMGVWIIFRSKPWLDAWKIEQELAEHDDDFLHADELLFRLTERKSKHWQVVITDGELKSFHLQRFGRFAIHDDRGFAVYSTRTLERRHSYEHIPFDFFRKHRGHVIAEHVMSDYFHQNRGNPPKVLAPHEVDPLAFARYLSARKAA